MLKIYFIFEYIYFKIDKSVKNQIFRVGFFGFSDADSDVDFGFFGFSDVDLDVDFGFFGFSDVDRIRV